MLSTSEVLDRHLKSVAEHDVDGILYDYSSDAVLFAPSGARKGPDAIRSLFEAIIPELRSRAFHSRCCCAALRGITPTLFGPQKQQIIGTNSLPTHLS